MITRCYSRASGLHFSVPLLFSQALPAAPRILFTVGRISARTISQQQQQRLSIFQFSISANSQQRVVGFPSGHDVVRGRGGGVGVFGALNEVDCLFGESRERSRIEPQFAISKGAGATELWVRRAFGSTSGAEAEEMRENSSPLEVSSSGSEQYLVGGKYCILLTGHASDYSQKLYGGYAQMFIKLLGDPYDQWDAYAVVDGQFPAEEELDKYDGFVVTGSRHDAHGSEDWIVKLCSLLRSLHEKKQNTLAVCFGHQVLSRALGGKTGKADVGWELGLRKIQTTDALATKRYAVGVPPAFRVLEVHQDQVLEMPPGAELLGFSERTGIEMFAVGDHALGIQGHPEFSDDVVKDLIDTRLASGILKEEVAKAARETLSKGQADQEALVRLCKGFLKRVKT